MIKLDGQFTEKTRTQLKYPIQKKIQHKNSLRVVEKKKNPNPHQQPHSELIKVKFIIRLDWSFDLFKVFRKGSQTEGCSVTHKNAK